MCHDDVLQGDRDPHGRWHIRCVDGDEVFGELDGVLMAALFGSHLYGTEGPESDLDIKVIFMESLRHLVLDERRSTVSFSTCDGDSPNQSDDIDVECIELQTFVSDVLEGHPYALELLHVSEEHMLLETETFRALQEARRHLLASHPEPFVGYCRSRARRYGLEGRRLEAVETVLEILESHEHSQRIETVVDALPIDDEMVRLIEKPMRGREEPVVFLEVVEQQFEMNARIEMAIDALRTARDRYRPREPHTRDERDWKDISHAYRMTFELRTLLEKGRLDFPLEQAERLRRIKRGTIPYERVQSELPELVETTTAIESTLPDEPDRRWARDWLVETYRSEWNQETT